MKRKQELTERQKDAMNHILAYNGRYKRTPTALELGLMLDTSLAAAQKLVKSLVSKGHIEFTPNVSRGIAIIE